MGAGGLRLVRSLVVGAAVALTLGEFASRRVSFAPRSMDADFGFVVANGATVRSELEGSATSHWAANGVRRDPGEEILEQVPPILVAGDSETEAKEVSDEQVFTAQAASALRAAGVSRRVLNIGIEGQRTPIYVANAPAYKRRFSQGWTVIAINDDDLMDDMFVQNASYFTGGTSSSPLELHVVPLGLGAAGLRTRYRTLRAHSALIQLGARQALGYEHELRHAHLFHAAEVSQSTPVSAEKYPVHQALTLLEAAYDGRLTILFISAFDPQKPSEPTVIERAVVQFCETEARSCVFARAAWPEFAASHRAPFGFPNGMWNAGHPNADGHRALGSLLGHELVRLARRGLL